MANTGVTRGYGRISLDTERSGSIEKQKERLRASETVAGRNPDKIVFYLDEGVSGSRDVKRPGRDGLLEDVRRGDRVIVTKIDRLARNVADLLDIIKRIKTVGASIRFIDNDLNTEGPYGEFMVTVIAAIAELEAKIISERRKESLESFARQGRHAVGAAPYGFQSVENPDGRGLVIRPHPEQAPVLRAAIQEVMAGVVQETARAATGLSKTGFRKLLTNPRLVGMTPDGDGVVTINGVPRVDPDAAILTMTEYRALQEFLEKPEKTWSRQDGYGRVLHCGACGQRLYKNVAKNPAHSVYRCRKDKHTKDEASASIMVGRADNALEAGFLQRYGDMPYTVVSFRDDESERLEAISRAMMRVDEVQRRLTATQDPDEVLELSLGLADAQRERIAAEAMPVERTEKEVTTGETIGEVWARSDNAEREALALRFGRAVVLPGRLPMADKLLWQPKGTDLRESLRGPDGPRGGMTLLEAMGSVSFERAGTAIPRPVV